MKKIIVENLTLSDYIIEREGISKIDVGKRIILDTGLMRCPHCKKEILMPKHGQTKFCCMCGLKMTVFGNSIRCSLGEE